MFGLAGILTSQRELVQVFFAWNAVQMVSIMQSGRICNCLRLMHSHLLHLSMIFRAEANKGLLLIVFENTCESLPNDPSQEVRGAGFGLLFVCGCGDRCQDKVHLQHAVSCIPTAACLSNV